MNDAVVVGGGLAGASAAITLARRGRQVVLLEREHEPAHKICGEFLGGVALRHLADLGVGAAQLGAHRISRMRIIRGVAAVEERLPFPGMGLSRQVLDEAMLDLAEQAGASVRRGVQVKSAARGAVVTPSGEIGGRAVLLATGKHELRGLHRVLSREPEDLVGFKMHFQLAPRQTQALDGAVELVLFADAYAGLQRVEDGRANLCLLVDRGRFQAAGATWRDVLADLTGESGWLRDRLADAEELFARPLSIHRVPYGFVHRALAEDGLFRLGDQMGVIPSFTGEGMAIALQSGRIAGEMVAEGASAEAYHAAMRARIERPITLATQLYRLGRTRIGQHAMMQVARHCPALLSLAARSTRIAA